MADPRDPDGTHDRVHRLTGEQLERACAMLGPHDGPHDRADDRADDGPVTVAYAVLEEGAAVTGPQLKDALLDRLPLPLVPAEVVVVERIPRTPNGKADTRELARMEAARPAHDLPGAPSPAGEPQSLVETVWRRAIGLPDDELLEDFFRAGGSSIAAIRAVSTLNAALRLTLPLVSVFRNSRPELFTAYLAETVGKERLDQLVGTAWESRDAWDPPASTDSRERAE